MQFILSGVLLFLFGNPDLSWLEETLEFLEWKARVAAQVDEPDVLRSFSSARAPDTYLAASLVEPRRSLEEATRFKSLQPRGAGGVDGSEIFSLGVVYEGLPGGILLGSHLRGVLAQPDTELARAGAHFAACPEDSILSIDGERNVLYAPSLVPSVARTLARADAAPFALTQWFLNPRPSKCTIVDRNPRLSDAGLPLVDIELRFYARDPALSYKDPASHSARLVGSLRFKAVPTPERPHALVYSASTGPLFRAGSNLRQLAAELEVVAEFAAWKAACER